MAPPATTATSRRRAFAAAAAALLVATALLTLGPGRVRGAAVVQEEAEAAAVRKGPGAAVSDNPAPAAAVDAASAQQQQDPAVWIAHPVRELAHDPAAFTQGLVFDRWCGEGGGAAAATTPTTPTTASTAAKPATPPPACRDVFWESTGMNGESTVRLVDVETGTVLASSPLPAEDFGEGLALVPASSASSSPRLLQLTWQSGKAYWHDAGPLLAAAAKGGNASAVVGATTAVPPPASAVVHTPLLDGWGAAAVPAQKAGGGASPSPPSIVLSDGSDTLTWVDAATGATRLRAVQVTDGGKAVGSLNELEWVAGPVDVRAGGRAADKKTPPSPPTPDSPLPPPPPAGDTASLPPPPAGGVLPGGEVWANVWGSECVARINPSDGRVVGWVIAPGLHARAARLARSAPGPPPPHGRSVDVLNGIAADPATGRVWLGGKYWPALFEVAFTDASGPGGPQAGQPAKALKAAREVCGRTLTI